MTAAQRRPDPRRQALTDLADAVNELVRPRRHTEIVTERVEMQREGRKPRMVTRRRAVSSTQPPLLRALLDAAIPAGTIEDGPSTSGGFESKPAAALEAVHILNTITAEAEQWRRRLKLDREPKLAKLLPRFVSATIDDDALVFLVVDAQRWVRQARVATGFDLPPWTPEDARCPLCQRRRSLVVAGDTTSAKCSNCGARWTRDTIASLANLIRQNQQNETLSADSGRCVWPQCGITGPHDRHEDGAGRLFWDKCDVPNAE